MTILIGSATVPSSTTVAVFRLPPGYANFTLFQPSGKAAVYIGTTPNVSAVNGMYAPNTPLNQETFTGSAGTGLYATTGGTAASSFSYIISTTS
jgi:hypothetical protein